MITFSSLISTLMILFYPAAKGVTFLHFDLNKHDDSISTKVVVSLLQNDQKVPRKLCEILRIQNLSLVLRNTFKTVSYTIKHTKFIRRSGSKQQVRQGRPPGVQQRKAECIANAAACSRIQRGNCFDAQQHSIFSIEEVYKTQVCAQGACPFDHCSCHRKQHHQDGFSRNAFSWAPHRRAGCQPLVRSGH